ncbi:protein IQ-DOMAIN 28-like isoform X2 [Malania oleifera]|uniref:protein IQ-DOMAIN 28-like isoform X2 n=1 Tax=Malania oleifera TaxID=397392 RepID=UPI0025ADD338|nr:protein IQ-DOMAIN 28-like isoform X2 [Malania oleifera]XP_057949832.1 protein IQ-DOMAIN 28-like isoform X2 [Malania oleifera]
MGKSPGKWIKTVLFMKKSSKSKLLKRRELSISSNREELIPASGLILNPGLDSHPVLASSAKNGMDSNEGAAAELPNTDVVLQSPKHDDDPEAVIDLSPPEDHEKIILEQAATKAQAAFKGYLARRAFRALKGIIRLQALIRGHLVRRQAVATLFCVQGIVRVQALVRGQKVRRSVTRIEVHEKQSLGKQLDAKCPCSFQTNTSTKIRAQNLSENAFVCKLLAPSSSAMPLRFQYGEGEPNSALDWLERWTNLYFWKPHGQSKKIFDSKRQIKLGCLQTVETEKGRSKHSIQPTANAENGSTLSSLEPEKFKRNFKKASSQQTTSIHEHPHNEIEKVKRNLRKVSTTEASDQVGVDGEKPKRILKKALSSAAPDILEPDVSDSSIKTKKDIAVAVQKQADVETSLKPAAVDELVDELHDHSAIDLQTEGNNGKVEDARRTDKEPSSMDDQIINENHKTSRRRASLPAKQDNVENGSHNALRVPSYMATTKSAKAKFRGQASPRLGQDEDEKNGFMRRHSLPAAISGKPNSVSPRVQRVVQTGVRGTRNDKSIPSRDGCDKVIQPDWRR